MTDFEKICTEKAKLAKEDLETLRAVHVQMPLMAELSNADVFMDLALDDGSVVVAAQARPSQGASLYKKNIVGEEVKPDNEPAVFHAFRTQMPMCDIKAITQENVTVRQNATPVKNKEGKTIAVLIREKDISEGILQEQKYQELARLHATDSHAPLSEEEAAKSGSVELREIHHRVKNNLQLVASILNIQARKSDEPKVKSILEENVSRILSISAIHDILTHISEDMTTVESDILLEQLRRNYQSLMPLGKEIRIVCEGDSMSMDAETAASVAMVITELVTNSFKYAFEDRSEGVVTIRTIEGILFNTITVSDNGKGFDVTAIPPSGMGYGIIRSTVEEKLHGKLHVISDGNGTKVSFDYRK